MQLNVPREAKGTSATFHPLCKGQLWWVLFVFPWSGCFVDSFEQEHPHPLVKDSQGVALSM